MFAPLKLAILSLAAFVAVSSAVPISTTSNTLVARGDVLSNNDVDVNANVDVGDAHIPVAPVISPEAEVEGSEKKVTETVGQVTTIPNILADLNDKLKALAAQTKTLTETADAKKEDATAILASVHDALVDALDQVKDLTSSGVADVNIWLELNGQKITVLDLAKTLTWTVSTVTAIVSAIPTLLKVASTDPAGAVTLLVKTIIDLLNALLAVAIGQVNGLLNILAPELSPILGDLIKNLKLGTVTKGLGLPVGL